MYTHPIFRENSRENPSELRSGLSYSVKSMTWIDALSFMLSPWCKHEKAPTLGGLELFERYLEALVP